MSAPLTAEQQRMIEENRRKALERRAQRLGLNAITPPDSSAASTVPQRFVPPFLQEAHTSDRDTPPPSKRQNIKQSPTNTDSSIRSASPALFDDRQPSPSSTAVGSFYKQANKPTSDLPPLKATPAQKPAVSTRGRCVPYTDGRFRVEVGYNVQLLALFKSIPSKAYDPAYKFWSFSMEHYNLLMTEAASIASVSLKPLVGVEGWDMAALTSKAQNGSSLTALLKLCNGWQKPGVVLQGQCVLLSPSRFEIDIGYQTDIIEAFKQMPSKAYDMNTRTWSFSLEDYLRLMERLSGIAGVEVEPLPRAIVQAFSANFEGPPAKLDVPEADLSCVDPVITSSLMPFQMEGVNFAVSKQGRLLLADEMGLGKTVQAICIAAYYSNEWPVLVVAPSSVRFTWAEAFRRWLPSLNPECVNVVVKAKDNLQAGLVNIVSYDLLSRMDKQLPGNPFDVIIMDESHFLKNIKTARCKAALPLLKAAKRAILLSGTPAMSRPAELYTQILAVKPNLFPSFHEFGLRYCDAKQLTWGWDYSGSSHLAELKLLLSECIMLRRLKSDVLSQLPSKQRKVVTVTIGDGVSKRTKTALSAAADQLAKEHRNKKEEKEALLMYYNHTAEAKLQAITEYITDMLECGQEKFLVFAHHKLVLDHMTSELVKRDVPFIRIDGTTPSGERQRLCDKFQFSTKTCVAVLSITAANMGLTLHAADLVIFAELFWNPGVLIQAEDRVHRIGQTNNVNIHYLVAQGTADDHLWPLIQVKMQVLKQVGLSESNLSAEAATAQFHSKDLSQRSITEMFERSFNEDDNEDTGGQWECASGK
ncbi:SWI/SNF-related matrix-associated actin-dependent regulator of chromatin subfamily A-like protein 1 isoform X1 [Stigmatopora nigra]